jgi:hypothetical protein
MIQFKRYAKSYVSALLLCVLLMTGRAYSQSNIAAIVQSTGSDVEKITGAYMKPFGDALGVYMNSGWFNTGTPHSLLGFDVTCTFNTMLVPKINKTYQISDLNLQNMQFKTGKTAPTIFGDKEPGPQGTVMVPDLLNAYDTVNYNLPAGTGLTALIMPTFQVGIGIMKNTDLTFRYVPELETPGARIKGKFSCWGVGLRHDLLQWLPGGKVIPLSLSLMGAYSQMNFGANFPNAFKAAEGLTYKDGTIPVTSTYDDQAFNVNVKAWNVNAILSKKILMLTIYVSGGYQSSQAEYSIDGTYPFVSYNYDESSKPTYTKNYIKDVKDPVTMTDKKLAYFKGSGGLRMNFAIVTLHADYTFGKYRVISGGLGISFR